MLTEKGGVCIMIGGQCCMFIPNNTPDGIFTKTLQRLTTLGNKLAKNSRVDEPFISLMKQWFENWKGMVVSIFTSLIIVLGVMTTVGCYIIPHVRGLIQRLRLHSPNRLLSLIQAISS
jgi:hypothetical protein